MDDQKQQGEGPLSSEALKRDEWRGVETIGQDKDASGHTPPKSDRDSAPEGSGQSSSGAVGNTVPPPD